MRVTSLCYCNYPFLTVYMHVLVPAIQQVCFAGKKQVSQKLYSSASSVSCYSSQGCSPCIGSRSVK